MGSNDPLLRMPQICLGASRKAGNPSLATTASDEDRKRSEDVYYSALIDYLGGEHWIHQLTENKQFPAFEGHQGNWRPDFLLPVDEVDGFKICEINSRFPPNGIDLTARIYKSLDQSEIKPLDLDVAGDPDHMIARLNALFHLEHPLHFVHNRENNPLVESLMRALGDMKPRLLKTHDLHLVPDETSPTGYKLQCVGDLASSSEYPDNNMEDIHQIALRLFVQEFASLSPEMQRQLAFLSSSDVRSIFLIHDKRILGILLQELDDLVNKHHVLTQRQADLLRERVIYTILPGSNELQQLIDSYHQGKKSKTEFILKPIRSGRGQGIVFGQDMSTSEWEALLDMKNPELNADRTVYIIQPVVEQAEGDMFLDEEIGV